MIELFCKDNLELLADLPDNHLNLIYSDVLFATAKNFGDYQDLPYERDAFDEFYYPRVIEMRRVLKDNGTIYLHTGVNSSHWLKVLMDNVFGYKNFRNEIIWYYNSAPRKKNSFSNRHDVILRYSKSDNFYFNSAEVREPYSLSAPRGFEKEKYYHPLGKVMSDVWQINSIGQNDFTERFRLDGKPYFSQKPLALMERIIKASSNPSDLCADFFCGSGSFVVACKNNNRSCIGVDINPRAIEITNRRLDKH
jgi:site-specific DNA-methyltransferase (adenine-specific)